MSKIVQLNLSPPEAADQNRVLKTACKKGAVHEDEVTGIRILKRSVDARRHNIRINLTVEVLTRKEPHASFTGIFKPVDVTHRPEVIIIGAGPAGLFAALRLIELGIRPVLLERGKSVSERKKDIADISRLHIVNPDSNYCFGEGGAGTFSDGKLYTRSKKRGDNSRVLELLHFHGADENILYEAHPHIGTDKLPRIIAAIRSSIIDAGGIYFFQKRVTDFIIEGGKIKGVITDDGDKFYSQNVILATGHSARDIFSICVRREVETELKPFAMGVRVEHPQELIDMIQYHGLSRGEYLPAASYNVVKQVDGRGVYSFCMCPGGFIVPSATSQEEIVVNGMSPSGRNSPFANSGIVVEIKPEDLTGYLKYGHLAGLNYQMDLERKAWEYGGRKQVAPAQRLQDFVDGISSDRLPSVSYFPGVTTSPLHEWLPQPIYNRLKTGFRMFGSLMKGFLTNEAVVVGVESRTSSPLRIPRNLTTFEHIRISGLFPAGEGSGYAGGIVSSAVDGMRVAESVAARIKV